MSKIGRNAVERTFNKDMTTDEMTFVAHKQIVKPLSQTCDHIWRASAAQREKVPLCAYGEVLSVHTHRVELMGHVHGACAQQLPMSARGVSSSSPTALQRYVTYRNDWKLELAAQKVRGVNMKHSLRRPWYVRCVNMRQSLCHIFWNIQKTTLIVATRGAISFNLQRNWVPGRNVPFLICCVAMDTTLLQTARRKIAVRSANARGTGRGGRRKTRRRLWRSSRLS